MYSVWLIAFWINQLLFIYSRQAFGLPRPKVTITARAYMLQKISGDFLPNCKPTRFFIPYCWLCRKYWGFYQNVSWLDFSYSRAWYCRKFWGIFLPRCKLTRSVKPYNLFCRKYWGFYQNVSWLDFSYTRAWYCRKFRGIFLSKC